MNDPLLHLATEAARCLRLAEAEQDRLQRRIALLESMGVGALHRRIWELETDAEKGRKAIDMLMAERRDRRQ